MRKPVQPATDAEVEMIELSGHPTESDLALCSRIRLEQWKASDSHARMAAMHDKVTALCNVSGLVGDAVWDAFKDVDITGEARRYRDAVTLVTELKGVLATLIRFFDPRDEDPTHPDDKLPGDPDLWRAHIDRQRTDKVSAWDKARAAVKAGW